MSGSPSRRAIALWSIVVSFTACGLQSEGQLAGEGDASVVDSSGGAGAGATDSGWAASGGSAGSGGAPEDGAAGSSGGTGGVAANAGAAGSACLDTGESCAAHPECCAGACGGGDDPDDCNSSGKCEACNDDPQCSTGRCDGCKCVDPLGTLETCNEPSDCTSKRCGAGTGADVEDCDDADKCAECDDDIQCGTGRCEGCACTDKGAFGDACNEPTDCVSAMCGPEGADETDCNVNDKCAECRDDSECSSLRCDGCQCIPKVGFNQSCNEPSDCVSGSCGGNSKCD